LDEHEDFLKELLSRTNTRLRKAEDAFALRKQLSDALKENRPRFISLTLRNSNASKYALSSGHLIVSIESSNERGAAIVAGLTRDDVIASFTLLSFLMLRVKVSYDIYALGMGGRQPNISNERFLHALADLSSRKRIKLGIILLDAMPYFDGLYLGASNGKRAEGLIRHVENLGYTVGRYSLREDWPTYAVVQEDIPLAKWFTSMGMESYAIAVSDEIQAGVEALKYLLR
jgi:hypothetical protein